MSELFATVFCNKVAQNRKVWTLQKGGHFVAPKNPVSGEDGMPFWSSLSDVEEAINDIPGYNGYEPFEISWQNFVEEWAPRLTKEEMPVGLGWGGFAAVGGTLDAGALVQAVKEQTELDAIYDVVQNEFDYLDGKIGQNGQRKLSITQVAQIERDLYLVSDIVAITNNAGMMAWISYHHEEAGWIDCACEAFSRIGHPQVSKGLKECLDIYLKKQGELTYKDGQDQSRAVWDHEYEIMKSLYNYLIASGFKFPHSGM